MSGEEPPFRDAQPVAWHFHRNTARWLHNTLDPEDGLRAPAPPKEYPLAPTVPLGGNPGEGWGLGFVDLLRTRVSCRAFARSPVPRDSLGRVLWAGYGLLGRARLGPLELLERPVPSGGGLYPLEVYVLALAVEGVAPGVYHYAPLHHALEQVRDVAPPRRYLTYLFMGQDYAAAAGAVLVTTAVVARSLTKYGDRGFRYVLFESGHLAQNMNLAATALDLGACNLGGFFDDELAGLLGLDVEREIPLYGLALGVPSTGDRTARRAIDQMAPPRPDGQGPLGDG